ncbi:MAG: hypothetical protein U0U70_15480 [Chitinophagaceae bacterium]
MKRLFLLILLSNLCYQASSQLAISKLLGKNSKSYKMGLGVFENYEFPLNDDANQSIMLELVDFAYFRPQNLDTGNAKGYISIKVGYRYIFSDSKTGIFIEPQAGYVRTADTRGDGVYKDGFALAFETGYSLEVGQGGNTLVFGVKYEADNPGNELGISSIAFRISYSFPFLRKGR